ncbi:MAG: Fe-S assembly protein IscX [Acidobacteria bacterium]|nr:MAG: Fe-S assembly protein IscX [Acidobacteriota bacterium]
MTKPTGSIWLPDSRCTHASDAEDIGILLAEKFPDTDPLTVRFTDLHRFVTELPTFNDDPGTSNEGKLEAIQMAWYEEWKDSQ